MTNKFAELCDDLSISDSEDEYQMTNNQRAQPTVQQENQTQYSYTPYMIQPIGTRSNKSHFNPRSISKLSGYKSSMQHPTQMSSTEAYSKQWTRQSLNMNHLGK